MTADLDLARRAVACRGWDWSRMYGAQILNQEGRLVGRYVGYGNSDYWAVEFVDDEPRCIELGKRAGREPADGGWMLPDLTDPATFGCLLALVREAHGRPCWMEPADDFDGWLVMSCYAAPQHNACEISAEATEAEALVAALEAAP